MRATSPWVGVFSRRPDGEGASLPVAGALAVLPALATAGLLQVAEEVLGLPRAAFYSLRTLLLSRVLLALLGEPRPEGATRVATGRPGPLPALRYGRPRRIPDRDRRCGRPPGQIPASGTHLGGLSRSRTGNDVRVAQRRRP
jgi:hypothetical protein